jgi:hypothetical protein
MVKKWLKKNEYSILFYFILFYYILFPFYFFYSIIIVQKSRVYPTLFCSNYFHKESTLFEKIIPFFMNTVLY